jgi:hypothetical protein
MSTIKNKGQSIPVTTTAAMVVVGHVKGLYTLVNGGAGTVYVMEYDPDVTMVGTGAQIMALGGGALLAGDSLTVNYGNISIVCGSDTGTTATVRSLPGLMGASTNLTVSSLTVNTDIDKINGTVATVNAANKTDGTLVVNQATDGVNGVAFGLAADAAAIDGSFHAKLEYIGSFVDNIPSQGTAAMVASTPVTIATDDTMITALDTALDIVAGDTTSIDGKTPALGAAAMAASVPVTLATDDTNTTPFVTAGGGGYVRQDSTGTIAKETGGNLAAIAASVDIGSSMESVAVDLDAGAAQEVIAAPAAGHQLWIYGYELHANIGGTYQFLSAATAKTGSMPAAALGGVARDSSNPIFKCGTAEALNLTAVTCAADGIITYRDVTI